MVSVRSVRRITLSRIGSHVTIRDMPSVSLVNVNLIAHNVLTFGEMTLILLMILAMILMKLVRSVRMILLPYFVVRGYPYPNGHIYMCTVECFTIIDHNVWDSNSKFRTSHLIQFIIAFIWLYEPFM